MAIKLDTFLNERGFHANPFATTNAEQETEFLPAFFKRVDWFDRLVGNPQSPESLILFAPQGHGKTSHRIELGRRAGEHETPALVLTLNDFSTLVRKGLDCVTIDTYVGVIRQLFLEAFDAQIKKSVHRLDRIQADPELWPFFCALLDRYAPRRKSGHTIPPNLPEHVTALERSEIGAKAWLKELSGLVRGAGFASVYVLLDGVDELYETRGKSQAIFRLISPLLDAPGLLQECGFAFKFFLPKDLEAQMQEQQVGRLDRIPTYSLTWTPDQLRDMLSQRLTAYSLISPTNPAGLVSRFKDLCTVDFDVDTRLAMAAQTSPRRMLDLAREIVLRHCDRSTEVEAPIDADTILGVLPRQAPDTEPSSVAPALPNITPPKAVLQTERPLYIDRHGDVWLGESRLETEIPGLVRKCLTYLWQHRDRSVSYAELEEALYNESNDQDDELNKKKKRGERGDPKSSREKLVRRLRELLEPDKPSSRYYIDIQPGVGYVLRNFRDS